MDKTPFSVYDFLAYLSSGAVLLATVDYVMGYKLLWEKEVTPIFAVFLIILAYACGHVVAHFASFLLEHIVVQRLLKWPDAVLLGEHPHFRLLAWVFPNYFRPLPQQTQRQVREQAEARGFTGRGEALFLHAYPIVTSNPEIQARLDAFRNQYGFARNMSFVFLVSAAMILLTHKLQLHSVSIRWAVLAALMAVALFYRYLKFFRQYSYELFVRYASLPSPQSPTGSA